MLTGLSIGNFKAFGETQRVPIKPLTLIFGANSAGKSSLLHGLLLGSHALKTGDLNVRQTGVGGDIVDLGGFDQFVHGGLTKSSVEWGVELAISSFRKEELREMFRSFRLLSIVTDIGLEYAPDHGDAVAVKRLRVSTDGHQLIDCECAHVTAATTRWRCLAGTPSEDYLTRSGRPSATTTFWIYGVNPEHPALKDWIKHSWKKIAGAEPTKADWRVVETEWETICDWPMCVEAFLPNCVDGHFASLEEMKRRGFPKGSRKKAVVEFTHQLVGSFLNIVFEQIHEVTTDELDRLTYLGPLRALPPRRLIFPLAQSRPGDGSFAWQIVAQDKRIRARINEWLTSPSKFNTSLELFSREWRAERGERMAEVLIKDRRTKALVSHRDVGVGISQVLPMMVTALSAENGLHLIEQPELHLHPALQAELGDLFIESALGERRNTFLIETHSEHLLLRIMRRMRETSEGRLSKGLMPIKPNDVAVLFVQPDGSRSIVRELPLNERGELLKQWPGGFFEEGLREVLPAYAR